MNERIITREEFLANGGHKNSAQWTTGCPACGNIKFWTRAKA